MVQIVESISDDQNRSPKFKELTYTQIDEILSHSKANLYSVFLQQAKIAYISK